MGLIGKFQICLARSLDTSGRIRMAIAIQFEWKFSEPWSRLRTHTQLRPESDCVRAKAEVSMKIMRFRGRPGTQPFDVLRLHRDHSIQILQHAVDNQEPLAQHLEFVTVESIGRDDRVHDAGLVLQAQEYETLGGA